VKGGLDIHFTSFKNLEPRVKDVERRARSAEGQDRSPVTFYDIGGTCMIKRLEKKTGKPFEREIRKPGMDIISLKSPWSRAKQTMR
jgi:hypothetical protein